MKLVTVDPRAWNILAGLCLASGCGGRTLGADTSGTDTSSTNTSSSTDTSGDDPTESSESSTETTLETNGYECMTDADCPEGQYCEDYGCAPIFQPECQADADCDVLEICAYYYCQSLPSPPACPAPAPAPSLTIPIATLALSFVDVDDDGADELVIATQSELQVYESGSDIPLISPRGLDSASVRAMVGGPFDAMAGEDVVILFADELRLHGSDGVGNFAAPSVSPSGWFASVGLLAGDFDGEAPADLLIWSASGAGVELGSGGAFPLSADAIESATARSLDDPVGGFALQYDAHLDFYNAAGASLGIEQMRADPPHALTSISNLGNSFDLSSSVVAQEWTLIEEWGPAGILVSSWGLLGQVNAMAGGDFDGDGWADVAMVVGPTVQIHFGVLDDSSCLASYPFAAIAVGVAVGDHDGDGDDEIAVRFEAGNVVVLDGE